MQKRLKRSRRSLGCSVGWVQETCITWDVDAPTERGTFGGVRPIEKHCTIVKHGILGVGWNGRLCKIGWIDLNDLCVFLRKELAFGVAMSAPALKVLVAFSF